MSLASIDHQTAPSVLAAAADVALVVDGQGVIQDIAFREAGIARAIGNASAWQGRLWADTVTAESRSKIKMLLDPATGGPQPRQVNHPAADGADVPIEYATVAMPKSSGVIAFGRDLRPLSLLQQRLVDAQQTLDSDYSRLRQAQTRYRVLFSTAPDALFLLDLPNLRVMEANPAAQRLLDLSPRPASAPFGDILHPEDRPAALRQLAAAPSGTEPLPVQVRLAAAPAESMTMTVNLLLEQDETLLVVRLGSGSTIRVDTRSSGEVGSLGTRVLAGLHAAPDGFVLTDMDGDVLDANSAFLTMAQLPLPERARGRSLDTWLGQSGVDLSVLLANLRQRGSVRLFTTVVRGEHGASTDVEVSAGAASATGQTCFAFVIRDVARRFQTGADRPPALSRSIEQLTELIGRVSLKELVRDATDVIERLCIEAALELTGNNRASAAEMLGLSRQSLYVKLRRYDLGSGSDEDDDKEPNA